MSQTFEEWLIDNRKRDENVISGEERVEEIRQEIKDVLVKHFEETRGETWCSCDTCTLIRIRDENKGLINSLAYVGLEYLLGENFNGAAALYYNSYYKGIADEG